MFRCLASVLLALACLLAACALPALAASRGVTVQARTASGATTTLTLYSGCHALVIGAGAYAKGWARLPNAVADAREVAGVLRGLGWSVDLLEDPDGATLRRALNQLVVGQGRDEGMAILVWFSGHGHTIGEADGASLGYLVPVDAPDPYQDQLGFMDKAVSMRQVETISKQIRSKHVLMAFDSCFSGAIFATVRAAPSPYIEEKTAWPVRQFLTAGNENEQVPDKSVFKDVFVQGLRDGFADANRDGYVTGQELGQHLEEQVVNYSRKAQHPQFGKINNPKLDKGDFVFALAGGGSSSKAVASPGPDLAAQRREVEAERQRLEAERARLARDQPSLAEQQKLEAEQARLAAERARLEEERRKLEEQRRAQSQLQAALPGRAPLPAQASGSSAPLRPVRLAYLPAKTVVFRHETHAQQDCAACHHEPGFARTGAARKCAERGCHDSVDKTDKSARSLYQSFHKKGGQHESCVNCHADQASRMADDARAKALKGCAKSLCHP